MPDVEITASESGPYLVSGVVRLLDADGGEYPPTKGKAIALCRCGGSESKPFCDGTHKRIGFTATERAPSAH